MSVHPARQIPFDELRDGLQRSVAAKDVSEQCDGDLRLYCYTKSCVYNRNWNEYTRASRGLILDAAARRVVATPFPKFFNLGEETETVPDMPFDTLEKLDGSLVIIYFARGEWKVATKGSFNSSQAKWAAAQLTDTSQLVRGNTYLAEAVYAENRIVAHYDHDALYMLAVYDEEGVELTYEALAETAGRLGWRMPARYEYSSVYDLVERAKRLPANDEGFVLRFTDGTRLKIKGDEYRRIHALISNVTPLTIWRAMAGGEDLNEMRHDLPEEFWGDFDAIRTALNDRFGSVADAAIAAVDSMSDMSDKEVGLRLGTFPEDVRRLIFPCRKSTDDKFQSLVFKAIRPEGNRLPGYTPSYAINAAQDTP